MAGSADFLGVNYYQTGTIRGVGLPVDPGGLREVLEIAAMYGKPLWITENGISNGDDSQRPSYIVRHLAVVQDAIATDHMNIVGYTYWSLVDLLEWSDGYDSHFGLYSFDPGTLERTSRPSVAVLHQITTSNALSAVLLADYGSDVL